MSTSDGPASWAGVAAPTRDPAQGYDGRVLAGASVTLRQVRDADADVLYDAHADIRNRGPYFPLGDMSQTEFRGEFAQHGFW